MSCNTKQWFTAFTSARILHECIIWAKKEPSLQMAETASEYKMRQFHLLNLNCVYANCRVKPSYPYYHTTTTTTLVLYQQTTSVIQWQAVKLILKKNLMLHNNNNKNNQVEIVGMCTTWIQMQQVIWNANGLDKKTKTRKNKLM